MKLTSDELAAVEQLRKHQKQWPLIRWALLAFGVFQSASFVQTASRMWALMAQVDQGTPTAPDAWLLAKLYVPLVTSAVLATVFLVWPLASWRSGNRIHALVLRLVDDATKSKDA